MGMLGVDGSTAKTVLAGDAPLGDAEKVQRGIMQMHRVATGGTASPQLKRALDLALILVSLPSLVIVFAIVSLAIYMGDGGPVFYRQRRLGKGGRLFSMYKFRSMVANAQDMQQDLEKYNECRGGLFKMSKDPRVTFVGRFLRRSSLDELPQLINVLTGDMSLIGPRACSVDLDDYLEHQKRRLDVKPGIVGPAQIWLRHGDFNEKTELELAYVDLQCTRLDVFLLMRGMLAAVKSTGV